LERLIRADGSGRMHLGTVEGQPLPSLEGIELGRPGMRALRNALSDAAAWWDAEHEGVNLAHADLAGANLRRAGLEGANLTGANLAGALLSGANLREALLERADLGQADLANARLGGAVLGAAIVLIANRRHAVDRQILDHVQRIGAVFANTAQRGRAARAASAPTTGFRSPSNAGS